MVTFLIWRSGVCVCVCVYVHIEQVNLAYVCMLSCFSHVWFFVTLWTVACQAPLSMGFSRRESWSGLPFPPPGDLPNPGIKPKSLTPHALAGRFFTTSGTLEAQFSLEVGENLRIFTVSSVISRLCCLILHLGKLNPRKKPIDLAKSCSYLQMTIFSISLTRELW